MDSKGALLATAVFTAVLFLTGPQGAADQKPTAAKSCSVSGCHRPLEKILRGTVSGISWSARTIQINTGAAWLVKFGEDTKLTGAEKWSKIPKEKEIAITTTEKNGELYAAGVSVKPPVKIAPEKLITADEMSRLAAIGPDRGGFVLIDSRPEAKYNEGHIPGAISVPDSAFEKNLDRLPKDRLLIFYCAGPTCRLSASSAAKAEKAGCAKVKVFLDGMPAWKKTGNIVYASTGYLKETLDKSIPTVLIDLRPVNDAKAWHIPGAVSVPAKDISQARDRFPSEKSAPVILYAGDTQAAAEKFKMVRGWGYGNASVLEGGIEAWRKAGGLVIAGDITSKITYVPRLGPGEVSIEDFRKIAETRPADKLILDVREEDEAVDGTIAGARNVPVQSITARLSEIPKDKEIITYCATGVRAEMAFHALREAGYKVRFLNAKIEIANGKYAITRE